jgi:hypothetical protein
VKSGTAWPTASGFAALPVRLRQQPQPPRGHRVLLHALVADRFHALDVARLLGEHERERDDRARHRARPVSFASRTSNGIVIAGITPDTASCEMTTLFRGMSTVRTMPFIACRTGGAERPT